MSTYAFEAASINPAALTVDEQRQTLRKALLADAADELAGLRFSIILTGKWEGSDSVSAERRVGLRAELSNLRSLYLDKIDEIAMEFGVKKAMETKEEVERTVSLPNDMSFSMMPIEGEELCF